MNFCTQCGHPARGSTRFCTNCGAPQHPADDRPAGDRTADDRTTDDRTAPAPEDRGATPSGLDSAGPVTTTAPITPEGAWPGTEPPTFTAPATPPPSAAPPAPPPRAAVPPAPPPAAPPAPPPAASRPPPPPDLPAQTAAPYWPAGEPPEPEPETLAGPWRRRRFPVWLPLAAAAVVVLGGLAGWYLTGSHGSHPPASAGSSPSVTSPGGGGSAQAATAEVSTPAPSPSGSPVSPTAAATATPGSTGTGTAVVTLGPGVSGQPAAAAIATFLGQYFKAINDHDYQAYISLFTLSGQQGHTPQAFNSGSGTSTDSGERLVALSPAQHGKTAATIVFTSHQSPSQSATKSACTVWRITLYLRPAGTSYLIGRPPGTYHASAKACA